MNRARVFPVLIFLYLVVLVVSSVKADVVVKTNERNANNVDIASFANRPTDDFIAKVLAALPKRCIAVANDVTNCRSNFAMWQFSLKKLACVKYKGCFGGPNKFLSFEDCRSTCAVGINAGTTTPAPLPSRCFQAMKPGSCMDEIKSFYFDQKTQSCSKFSYSGCGGNQNRFETLAECEKICPPRKNWPLATTTTPKPLHENCLLPKVVGNCADKVERYYYDKSKETCRLFTYSGCGGNSNRFSTLAACRDMCPEPPPRFAKCYLQVAPGDCDEEQDRYYFDTATGRCETFIYSGCKGNDNRFKTLQQCEDECPRSSITTTTPVPLPIVLKGKTRPANCFLPVAVGNCKGRKRRYYFDAKSKRCQRFSYTGCGGNRNRFYTMEDCVKDCRVEGYVPRTTTATTLSTTARPTVPSYCSKKRARGPCKDRKRRFYYDKKSKTCKSFTYGGCEGNENRFSTKEYCELICMLKPLTTTTKTTAITTTTPTKTML